MQQAHQVSTSLRKKRLCLSVSQQETHELCVMNSAENTATTVQGAHPKHKKAAGDRVTHADGILCMAYAHRDASFGDEAFFAQKYGTIECK